MTNFQQSLDRWLTTEPVDNYTPFWEKVISLISERVWNIIEIEDDKAFDEKKESPSNPIIFKAYSKGITPQRTAAIIERIYREKT